MNSRDIDLIAEEVRRIVREELRFHGLKPVLDWQKLQIRHEAQVRESKNGCTCKPVGCGDGDTYIPDPRCMAHAR